VLEPLPETGWTPQAAAHLLNRAAFGGTPGEIQKLHARGHRGAVESLLDAGEESHLFPAPEMEPLAARIHALKTENPSREAFQEGKKRERTLAKRQTEELREWWLRRMLESPNPAREKAVLFWHGHWATGIRKVDDPFLMHRQNETLRSNALGPFAPLARQISRDPAMIIYLDLQSSSAKKPNENFAREFMELFTLGEGHYSESDIAEAARAFTGYRTNQRAGSFEFRPKQADSGTKTFFGKTGPLTGDDVVDIIVAQPRCPEFLAAKIWTFYAGTPPPDALQQALGEEYRLCGMDTGELLRTIFTCREFYEPGVVRRQIKSPVQWLIQMCKALEIAFPSGKQSRSLLSNLGQKLFDPPNVKGWDGGRAWISSSTLLVRYNAAGNIVRGGAGPKPNIDQIFPSALPPEQAVDRLAWRLFQSPMPPALRGRALAFLSENGSSPAARRDLLHLLMSTPEYQLT